MSRSICRCWFLLVVLNLAGSVWAEDPPPIAGDSYVSEQGEHFNVLQKLEPVESPGGTTSYRTNTVIQLESGLNYRHPLGFWQASEATFRLEGGDAIGDQTPHKVRLPGILGPQTRVHVTLPDGSVAESRVFGLAYYEPESGRSVLLAELKDSNGVLEAPNQIVYPDAFTDLVADLVFIHRRSGIEQDVVLREAPPGPEEFGLDPAKTRLEVWTEFLAAPEPELQAEVLNPTEVSEQGSAPLVDHTVDFGSMRMDRGTAFPDGAPREFLSFVSKEWLQMDGNRNFLVETVEYGAVESGLRDLPASQEGAFLPVLRGRAVVGAPRGLRPSPYRGEGIQIASATHRPSRGNGLVLDYTLATSATNFVFAAGETYYVTGPVVLSGTNTTFEAGVVVKYAKNSSAKITINTPVSWRALPYRPVVLAASDDATVGEVITTNALSGFYADTALEINTTSAFDLPNLRISHAKTGIRLLGTGAAVLRHAQFVNCETGVSLQAAATATVRNGLFHNVLTNVSTTVSNAVMIGEHVTVNTATWLNPNSALKVVLTNSILAGVTNTNPYTNVNVSVASSPASVFQVVGAGSNYLQAGNTNRNAGVTTINVQLASDLKLMTTTAPTVNTSTYTTNITLSPVVARDTDIPDRGYHYWPVDYAVNQMTVTNAAVTLTNGVAVAVFGSSGLGLRIVGSASLCVQGSPTNMVRFTRFTSVQEQPFFWSGKPPGGVVTLSSGTTNTFGIRFAEFSYLPTSPKDYPFWTDGSPITRAGSFLARDCQFFESNFQFWGPSTNPPPRVVLVNNLFEGGDDLWWSGTLHLEMRNNLFRRAALTWQPVLGDWILQDNLFDSCDIFEITPTYRTHNAFWNCTGAFTVTNTTEITLSSLTYQSATNGSLVGRYYLPSNSPLIDKGSRSSAQSRLAYHTTQTSQTRENTSTVDIGFHYVAVTGTGVPLDLDTNGNPDYFENQSGQCPCEYPTCQNIPPSVALIAPLNNTTNTTSPANIAVSAIAADPDNAIVKVEFLTNGVAFLTNTAAPYSGLLQAAPAGTHLIVARATDAAGGVTTTPANRVVVNGLPWVSWISPTGTVTSPNPAPGSLTLIADAQDTNGAITKVEFFDVLASSAIATLTSANDGPNRYKHTWTPVAAGKHAISIKATDSLGAVRWSDVRLFNVGTPNPTPTILITSPATNQSFKAWSDVQLTAKAYDGQGLANVSFFREKDFLGMDSYRDVGPGAITNYSIILKNLAPGTYKVSAKAMDIAAPAASQTSAEVQFTVAEEVAHAATGFWDPRFANLYSGEDVSLNEYSLAVDPSGNVYSGSATQGTGSWLRISKWSSCAWTTPVQVTPSGEVLALCWHDGSIHAAGRFDSGAVQNHVAKLTGSTLAGIGDTFGYTDTTSPYSKWSVRALASIDGTLYAGGDFTSTANDPLVDYIARYDSVGNRWKPVGNGLSGIVRVIVAYDDTIYIGGDFQNAGGNASADYLAKLVSGTWQPVGTGVNGPVLALAVSGDRLVVGGAFSSAEGVSGVNNIAVWDGNDWSAIGGGVTDGTPEHLWHSGTPEQVLARVDAIVARGNDVFVAGDFRIAWNGSASVNANYVARARWDTGLQEWNWAGLDGGLTIEPDSAFESYTDRLEHARALAIREHPSTPGFDLIVGGFFTRANGQRSYDLARWVVGNSDCPTDGPTVTIGSPGEGTTITGTSVNLSATAAPSASAQLTQVAFFTNGVLHEVVTGTTSPFTSTWSNLAPGPYTVVAIATDDADKSSASPPINFAVKAAGGPTVANETYVITSANGPTNLTVLANDTGTGGAAALRIVGLNRWQNPYSAARGGVARIDASQKSIVFDPFPHGYGTNFLVYDVADQAGTNTGNATVVVRAAPKISITSPADGTKYTTSPSGVSVLGSASDADGTINKVILFVNGYATATNNSTSTTFSWSTNVLGYYNLVTEATDNHGQRTKSSPVSVRYDSQSTTNLIARITNLTNSQETLTTLTNVDYPTIREGFFVLQGEVYDTDLNPNPRNPSFVSYAVYLYRANDDGAPFANVTPGTLNDQGFVAGGDVSGSLGTLNLSTIPNGRYDLVLVARSQGQQVSTQVRVAIVNELKIGALKFSEEDLILPVSGIPITIVRSYDSLNMVQGDFGWCWSMAINDLQASFDEERVTAQVFASAGVDVYDGTDAKFSLRSGGSHNLSLNLPDGRRVTYVFAPRSAPGSTQLAYAEWDAPPGVTATLSVGGAFNQREINFFANGLSVPCWNKGDARTPFESHDIPGVDLTLLDGTVFELGREPHFVDGTGQPLSVYFENSPGSYRPAIPYEPDLKLRAISQPTGDRVEITREGIAHYRTNGTGTRSVWFERNAAGQIVSIRDPLGQDDSDPIGPELLRYVYNEETGNLVQVHRLVNRTSGTYSTNRYFYEHGRYPKLITSIESPTGVTRSGYDDLGRLTSITDPLGNVTIFGHDTANRIQTVTDRLNRVQRAQYDARGNVTQLTEAYGTGVAQTTRFAYDDNGNLTNTINHLNVTNAVALNAQNLPEIVIQGWKTTVAATNFFTYDGSGRPLTVTDARGAVTGYAYDLRGLLTSITNAAGVVLQNAYDPVSGLLVGSIDAAGIVTTNQYDPAGNLERTRTGYYSGNTFVPTTTNTFTYDANGLLTNSVNPAGMVSRAVYDAQNCILTSVQAFGTADVATSSYTYDAGGRQATAVNPRSVTTAFGYDAAGRRISVTNALGTSLVNVTRYAYDAEGNLTNVIDPLLRETRTLYDERNRPTSIYRAFATLDQTLSRNVYDAIGRVSYAIDGLGTTNASTYDELNRLKTSTRGYSTPTPIVTQYTYDANGNQFTVTDNLGRVSEFRYDALNRLTQSILPAVVSGGAKFTNTIGYDTAGRRTSETNAAGIVSRFAYDKLGRLSGVTNGWGAGAVTNWVTYAYDVAGNLTDQGDALSRTNSFTYDLLGRRKTQKLPGGQTITLGYDAGGNLLSRTKADTVVVSQTYDDLGRLSTRRRNGVTKETYAYSATGRLTNRVDEAGTFNWTYDNLDRLTKVAGPAGTLFYTYDDNGNLLTLGSATASGVTNVYQYDSLSRLTSATDLRLTSANKNTTYGFDGVGNLEWVNVRPTGVTNFYRYDAQNRLTNLIWKLGNTTLASFGYTLNNPLGLRTQMIQSLGAQPTTFTWSYDTVQRMTNEVVSGGSPNGTLSYAYSLVGNRISRTAGVGLAAQGPINFDQNDWLDTDSNPSNANSQFDANGNTVSYSSVTYGYDWLDRMTTKNSTAVVMVYDADGNRVKKTASGTTTWYLVSPINPTGYPQVVEELTGSTPTTLSRRYQYGLDLIGQTTLAGTVTRFFGTDGLGSTRFLTDTGGAVVENYAYDAYGNLIVGGTPTTAYLYTGEQWDADLGMYYLRARYLNPTLGRFWTADTYEGNQAEPLSLHKYLYAHANPVMNIDPSGNMTMTEALTVTFNVTKQFGVRAFSAYQVYDKADSVRNLAQLVGSLATGGSVSGLQIALTAVDFLPFGKLLKKMEKAGEVTKEGLDVLAGVFRQTRKSEAIGELGALMAARARGFKSVGFHPRYHGFDDIVEDASGNLIIVEAKGGSSALRQTLRGQQASQQWIADKIRILESGDAQERLLAARLRSQGDNLKVMVATTKADAAGTVTQDVVIKNWNEIGEFTFRLE